MPNLETNPSRARATLLLLPTIANVVRGKKRERRERGREILTAPLSRIKSPESEDDEKCWELRARRGWTKRKESHFARPSPRRGRGRGRGGRGPFRSGLGAPGPHWGPGAPRGLREVEATAGGPAPG